MVRSDFVISVRCNDDKIRNVRVTRQPPEGGQRWLVDPLHIIKVQDDRDILRDTLEESSEEVVDAFGRWRSRESFEAPGPCSNEITEAGCKGGQELCFGTKIQTERVLDLFGMMYRFTYAISIVTG